MAKKNNANKFEVLASITHDLVERAIGDIIEITHEETARVLCARGMIRPASEAGTEIPDAPKPETDPAMAPAAIKENDPGSVKDTTPVVPNAPAATDPQTPAAPSEE